MRFSAGLLEHEGRDLRVRVYVDGAAESGPPRPLCLVVGSSEFRGTGVLRVPGVLEHLGANGFVVAVLDHRAPSEGAFPWALRDGAAALRMLSSRADDIGVDANKIVLWGEGSGAWMAAMLATLGAGRHDDSARALAGGPVPPTRAAVCVSGPVGGFEKLDGQAASSHLIPATTHAAPTSVESVFMGKPLAEDADAVDRANPVNYVTEHTPPISLLHGDCDPLVPAAQSKVFFAALYDVTRGHAKKHSINIIK